MDTGSPVAIISYKIYCKNFHSCTLLPADNIIQGITGHELEGRGKINATATLDGNTAPISLVVIANGPCLLGLNALSQLKLHILFNTATHQKQISPDLFRKVMQCSENSGGTNIP